LLLNRKLKVSIIIQELSRDLRVVEPGSKHGSLVDFIGGIGKNLFVKACVDEKLFLPQSGRKGLRF
jgi:hypothetical protein